MKCPRPAMYLAAERGLRSMYRIKNTKWPMRINGVALALSVGPNPADDWDGLVHQTRLFEEFSGIHRLCPNIGICRSSEIWRSQFAALMDPPCVRVNRH